MTELAIRDEQHYLAVVREVRVLAERCDTVESAKDLADRAAAAKVYAERAKLGGDMVNRAAAAKLWAERRAGELLSAMPKHSGGRPTQTPDKAEGVYIRPNGHRDCRACHRIRNAAGRARAKGAS